MTNRFALKIKSNKTKFPSLTGHRTLTICTNGENIDGLDQLSYLATVVPVDALTTPNLLFCLKFENGTTTTQVEAIVVFDNDHFYLRPLNFHQFMSALAIYQGIRA